MEISELSIEGVMESSPKFSDVFSEPMNAFLVSKAIRWQAAKKRLGVRATKGISDIKATTKKPYRQKGTGRARQGSLVSPQFRGGAVIFGPVKRDHSFAMNKKERTKALRSVVAQRFKEGRLKVAEGSFSSISAKSFKACMDSFIDSWFDSKVLFIGEWGDQFILSSGAFFNVSTLPVCALNVRDLLLHDFVVLHSGSIDSVIDRLCK